MIWGYNGVLSEPVGLFLTGLALIVVYLLLRLYQKRDKIDRWKASPLYFPNLPKIRNFLLEYGNRNK